MALNRIQKNMIDQDFVKQVDDQAEQLAQRPILKIFQDVPSESELSTGELGLVLIPLLPFDYDFSGAYGSTWDKWKFVTNKYEASSGLMNRNASYSELRDGKGAVKVVKTADTGLASIEHKAQIDLDFTSNKKYRIRLDMKRTTIDGLNKGNCGISIAPSDGNLSYYPINYILQNGTSVYFGNDSSDNAVKVKYRKIVNSNMEIDQYIATNGGYAGDYTQRLGLPEGEFHTLDLIISTTSIQILINGTEYLNITDTLDVINSPKCKLVIWGSNFDGNSLNVEHSFDNLIVEEVV